MQDPDLPDYPDQDNDDDDGGSDDDNDDGGDNQDSEPQGDDSDLATDEVGQGLGASRMVQDLDKMLRDFDAWASAHGFLTSDGGNEKRSFFDSPYDPISNSLQKTPEVQYHLMSPYVDLAFFAMRRDFTVTSTNGGPHNVNSAHYLGLAIDIRTRDKTQAQIDAIKEDAKLSGIKVRDETQRPENQPVWSGPHLHLSVPKDTYVEPNVRNRRDSAGESRDSDSGHNVATPDLNSHASPSPAPSVPPPQPIMLRRD